MKALAMATAAALLLLFAQAAVAAQAAGLGKGAAVFGVQLTGGQADLTVPVVAQGGDFIGVQSAQRPEVGVQGQFWYFPTEHFAVSVSGGLGFTSETDEPGPLSDPAATDRDRDISSWQLRVGGDRVTHLAMNSIHVFIGPGLQVWSGKEEVDELGVETEGDDITRVALSGRIGTHLAINDMIGVIIHLDHFIGHATSKQDGAESNWWTSGNEGGVGLAFRF